MGNCRKPTVLIVLAALGLAVFGLAATAPAEQAQAAEDEWDNTRVAGQAVVGSTLKLVNMPAKYRPSYQWFCGSRAIDGATKKSFKITAREKGCRISIHVTYSDRAGTYEDGFWADDVVPGRTLPTMDQIVLSPSLTKSKYGSVVAVTQFGELLYYPWLKGGKLGKETTLSYWEYGMTFYAPGDWNKDGHNDLITIEQTTGDMNLYFDFDQTGASHYINQIGNGWRGYRVIPCGDLTGDGNPDLLAIKESTGDLFLYAGDGQGGFKYPYPKVGYGWKGYQLFPAGDVTKDGISDIVGIDAKGDLYLYAGKGNGTFHKKVKVGYGWKGYTLAAGADLNGDGIADLVGRDAAGNLYFYAGKG
ncbi:MAG: VCBS repeat-containing protein, partial [Micrococcales bacterium]|nr:VCBS repeat-containing protein [Micrococcales bacterium]